MSSHRARRNLRRRWLITAALVAGGILFVLPYLALATLAGLQALNLRATAETSEVFEWHLANEIARISSHHRLREYALRLPKSENWIHRVLALSSLPQLFVFTAWEGYLLAGLLTVALALAALRWGKPGRIIRVLLILTLLAVLFFPWLYRYEPAVIAAPGYAMRWPTQPDLLEGIARQNQISTERRPCTYTLLGWSAEEILYYQAICENGKRQVWAFDSDQSGSAQQTDAPPPNLSIDFLPRSQVLEQVRSPSVYPPEAEPYTRAIKVRADGLASPDGRWVAIVARHLYGPEDVIVVSSSSLEQGGAP